MPPPQLSVHRHGGGPRALISLVGEIDLATAPIVRTALARCLHDGARTIDVDLLAVTFCDVSGLNAFLAVSALAQESGTVLRLHRPPQSLVRVIEVTGCGFLLHSDRPAHAPSHHAGTAAAGAPSSPPERSGSAGGKGPHRPR
ncbi:STAS domain-containing protein [Streptomyces sp. NPDC006540]|uniref:STAS domain-containing protein n=1 Tax=Streptomyces sp. NPDC006540 TaxID=3155353 RepID=UPI0033BD0DD4